MLKMILYLRENMMDSLLLILMAVSLINIKVIKPINNIYADYSSVECCNGLKGLLALIVVVSHLRQYTTGGKLLNIFNYGYVVVAVFLFISGFGTLKQYINKKNYLEMFVQKKISTLLIPYLIVVVIYWCASQFTIGRCYTIGEVIASFFNGKPIATNSWYVIMTIVLMIVFFLICKCLREHYLAIAVSIFAFCLLVIPVFRKAGYGSWWYFSNFGFPIGMIWALYEKKIVSFAERFYNWIIIFILSVIVFFAILVFHDKVDETDITQMIMWSSAIFPVIVFLFSMKVKFGSPILKFYGSISFELYMIHGLFIDVLSERINSDFLWSIIAIVCSTIAAVLLHKMNKRIAKSFNSLLSKRTAAE